MDYKRHYHLLIERARNRIKPSGYTEMHHVVPRCMGGCDDAENLVPLTPEEHFVAHQLLVKMHPEHTGLIWAASAMCGSPGGRRSNNKMYGWLRRRFSRHISESQKGKTFSEETRAKMAAAKLGKKRQPHSEETKAKMRAARLGCKVSPETRARLSRVKKGIKYGPMSDESKRKKSESMKRTALTLDYSSRMTPERRAAQSERMKRIWAERKSQCRSG